MEELAPISCSSCQTENQPGRRFCAECGAALAAGCPECGTPNEPGEKFCGGCGAPAANSAPAVSATSSDSPRSPGAYTPKHLADKILQSKSALEGERKQVTVLFADVKGSTELAEQLDPEQWHGILNRFFEILAEGVHRFEGTVNQYTGDGIMALFGAPIAHEDHAQRACYAALHLQDAIRTYADELRVSEGISFAVRMGINSGEVVVGKIGDDLRMDYTAQGATVNLASRMQTLADPGKTLLAQATARLVEGYFDLRDLGESKVRGIAEPVRICELEGVGAQRTRLDRSRARGLSQFVGREREFEMLGSALDQAVAGNGRAAGVVADAGTGKSRLCAEFVDRCRDRGLRVLSAHCPAHGRSMAFLPVLELLRNWFEIESRDSDRDARRKIAGDLTLLGGDLQDVLPVLFDFLGIADPAEPALETPAALRQKQLFAFVRRLAQARSEREPGVLFIDDVHWIDEGSDAFLAQLVDVARSTRTLVLLNFRPEYRADWMQLSHYQQIPLAPLGEPEMKELLDHLLGSHDSLAGLSDRIYARTGGNPFFAEEIVQGLLDAESLTGPVGARELVSSVERIEIPPTVHAVLAARIDRLAEREKRVLQAASVIGREVPEPLLAAILDLPSDDLAASLAELKSGEFLFEQSLYPETVYSFKHALTRDVAYESQLLEGRRRLHGRVATELEERERERLDEVAGLLAHHWELSEQPSDAMRWHMRAADFAGLADGRQTLSHLRRILALLVADASDELSLLALRATVKLILLGNRMLLGKDATSAVFNQGRALAERLGARAELAQLLQAHAGNRLYAGDVSEDWLSMVEEAVVIGRESGDDEASFAARYRQMWTLLNPVVDMRRALELAAGIRRDLETQGELVSMAGFDYWLRAECYERWMQILGGDIPTREQESRMFDDFIERSRALRDFDGELTAHIIGISTARLRGDVDRVRIHARRGLSAAEESGGIGYAGLVNLEHGHAETAIGNWDVALGAFERAQTVGLVTAVTFAGRGLAEHKLGRPEQGRILSDQGMSHLGQQRWANAFDGQVHQYRARLLIAEDAQRHRDEIERLIEAWAAFIEASGMLADAGTVHAVRAELAGALGDDVARRDSIAAARATYLEVGATGHAERMASV